MEEEHCDCSKEDKIILCCKCKNIVKNLSLEDKIIKIENMIKTCDSIMFICKKTLERYLNELNDIK